MAHPTYKDPALSNYRKQARCEDCGKQAECTVHHQSAATKDAAGRSCLYVRPWGTFCDECTPNR